MITMAVCFLEVSRFILSNQILVLLPKENDWYFCPILHDPKQSSLLCSIAGEKVLPVLGNVGTGLNLPDETRSIRVANSLLLMLSTQSNHSTLLCFSTCKCFLVWPRWEANYLQPEPQWVSLTNISEKSVRKTPNGALFCDYISEQCSCGWGIV